MVEIIILGPVLTLVMLVLVVLIVLYFGRDIIWLIVNSVIGLVALWVINLLPFVNITINIWSILIVALGGVAGLILLILLSALNIAF